MIPLTLAQVGDKLTVQRIGGNDKSRKHLENLGFVAGSEITLVSAMNGNVIVNVKNTRIAISEEMASKIMI